MGVSIICTLGNWIWEATEFNPEEVTPQPQIYLNLGYGAQESIIIMSTPITDLHKDCRTPVMAMILAQASNGCAQYMHIRPQELYPFLIWWIGKQLKSTLKQRLHRAQID